jgi:hypothetical protein
VARFGEAAHDVLGGARALGANVVAVSSTFFDSGFVPESPSPCGAGAMISQSIDSGCVGYG